MMDRALWLALVALAGLLCPAAHGQAPSRGLVGHWTLDDADGSKSAADSSVHGNPAKCGPVMALGSGMTETVNCPTFAVTGKLGTAAEFQGIANFLVVNNTIANSFTVTAWIRTVDAGNGQVGDAAYQGSGIVWSDISGAAADMIPMALQAGHLSFGTGNCNGGAYDTLVSSGAVNTGKWVFVAVTRDAATGEKRLYADGKLDAHHESTGTCALNANKIVTFGGNPLDDRYFKGALDDIRFYDRALSADEIASVMKPPRPAAAVAQAKAAPPQMQADHGNRPASAPASPASADPFLGTWQADMSTVPPQSPPLKSQTYNFAETPGGFTTRLTMVQLDKTGGTTTLTLGNKILFGGKPYKGGMGETRSCNPVDPHTIRCAISIGPNHLEETLTMAADGKSLTDSMKVKGPDGKDHVMSTVYMKTSSAAPANKPVVAKAGGQRIVTKNGECEVTVPAGWTVDQSMRHATSPDFGVDVVVFSRDYMSNLRTLVQLKPLIGTVYKPVKTFEDTPKRLWYQYAPFYQNNNGWYVAVLGRTGICALEIGFKNSVIPDAALAKKIALSLKPVP